MTPFDLGRVFGLVLLVASLVAGWRPAPFKWVAVFAAVLLAVGVAFGGSPGIVLAAMLAFLFWYGVARGARRLFGGGEGYNAP